MWRVVHLGLSGDHAVARLAEAQYGVVERSQLFAIGLGRRAIAHRLECGRLHRVHRGVYCVGHTAPMDLAREMAAVLACGPRAVLSHRSAAYLWALLPSPSGDVAVTTPARRDRPGIEVHRSPLRADEFRRHRRIPVTSPERTLLDLAAETTGVALERLVAGAERLRLVTLHSLLSALERSPTRAGTAMLRAILRSDQSPQLTRSEAEGRLLELVRAARLPPPEHNVLVGSYELDVIWPTERLAVEVDGYAYHSGRAAFERDRARDADLQAAGVRVIRVTWRQLVDEPEAVVARLATALSA